VTQIFKVRDGNLSLVSGHAVLGDDSIGISLDTMGLAYSWQARLVDATPYQEDIPLGPNGLPKHLEITLIPTDADESPESNPVIYIIPVEAYKQLWEENDDDSVSMEVDAIDGMLQNRPDPFPASNVPVLPFEEVSGDNDFSVQGKFMEFDKWECYRFVGRFALAFDPVTNAGMRYIVQDLQVIMMITWLPSFFLSQARNYLI